MKGRVNTGGGSGLNASIILVTAPTGSTVTCVKGDKTKTAVEKNGLWTFRGIENGEWTVRATKGGQSTSQPVNVTQFDVYRVTLAYFNATIAVTFPSDCTSVTCTKGDTVLSVPSGSLSSGSYTFNIPEVGEWVLYCTNGIDSDTETVNVTEEKAYSVALSFLYYLYNTGDECTAVTGGWKARKQGSRGTFTKKETSIFVKGIPDNGMNAATINTIDLTPFSTAKIRLVNVSSDGGGTVFFTTNGGYSESGSGILRLPITSKPKVVSLDIKALEGSYYAVFNTINNCEIEFDQMWLEE